MAKMAEKQLNNIESDESRQETATCSDFSTAKIQEIINDFKTTLEKNQIHFKGQLTLTVGASAVDVLFHSKAETNIHDEEHVEKHYAVTEFTKNQGQYRYTAEVVSTLPISEPQGKMLNSVSSATLHSKFLPEAEQKDFVKFDDLLSTSGCILPSFGKVLPGCYIPPQHNPESPQNRFLKTDNLNMDSEMFYNDSSASINESGSKYTYSKEDLVFEELKDHINAEQQNDSFCEANLSNLDIITADSFLNKSIKHLSQPSVEKSNGNNKKMEIQTSLYNEDFVVNSAQAIERNICISTLKKTSKDSDSFDYNKQTSLNGNSFLKRVHEITDFETLKKRNIPLNELGKLSHSELVCILTDLLQNIFPGNNTHKATQVKGENILHNHHGQIEKKLSFLQQEEMMKSQSIATLKEDKADNCTKVPEKTKRTRKQRAHSTKISKDHESLEVTYFKNDVSVPNIATKYPNRKKTSKSFRIPLQSKRKLDDTVSKISQDTKLKEFEGYSIIKPKEAKHIQLAYEIVAKEVVPIKQNKDLCLDKDQAKSNVDDAESLLKKSLSKQNGKLNNTQESYACSECSKTFPKKVLFRRHLRSHSTGYQCDICGKTLKTKDSLYHHQRGLHTKDKPYKCKQCSATFNFHHSYKLHVQRHKGERPHKCQTCHKTYLTSNHLKVHIEATHGVGSIICHICGKTFSYSCSLKQHLQKHSGERPFPCDKCSKSFPSKQSLRAHSLSHIPVKNFSCEVCGKSYKSEYTKNAHVKRHGKQQRQFMCELCGKAFLFKSSLQSHMNIHSKARPYQCLTCGKAFKSKASLYTHKYVHRESQSFLCALCGKAFKTKNCCAAHMKRHDNDATYSCSQCGSTFPDKGGLSKHVKTIHVPKKNFICKICGKKGTRGDNMRTHVKSHRNEVTEIMNPLDFILEETLPASNSSQGCVIIRPRMRIPKQKGSRRMYIKNVIEKSIDIKFINEHQYQDVQTKVDITTENINKSELPALSTLPNSLINVPLMAQAQYNTHLTYLTDDSYMEDISASQISALQPGNHQNIKLYPHDQSKASFYYMSKESEITGPDTDNNPIICYEPMASLLSAIDPSPDQGKVLSDSVYENSHSSLHAASRQESSLSVSCVYSDTDQGNTATFQQTFTQENTMHTSNYLVDHPHTQSNLYERPDVDF